MRIIQSMLLAIWAASFCCGEELSAEARQLHRQLSLRLAPSVRVWVLREAQLMRADSQWDERRVRADAQSQFAPQVVIGHDLDALVFLAFVEVLEQIDREIVRRPIPVTPAQKSAGKKTVAPTNAPPDVPVGPAVELKERRAKLADRIEELGRQLSGLSETLLREMR